MTNKPVTMKPLTMKPLTMKPLIMKPVTMKPLTSAPANRERGQTTAEYALVLLAAGTIAMLVVSWAQGNDAIATLFDAVLSKITSLIS